MYENRKHVLYTSPDLVFFILWKASSVVVVKASCILHPSVIDMTHKHAHNLEELSVLSIEHVLVNMKI